MNKDYIYKRRLLKLANFLDKLPPHRFDFRTWAGYNWKGKADLSCGTSACAMGWATTFPSFRRLGLRLAQEAFGSGRAWVYLKGRPRGDGPWLAGKKIFGLNKEEFNFLFISYENINVFMYDRNSLGPLSSAKEVANHIRFFAEKRYE